LIPKGLALVSELLVIREITDFVAASIMARRGIGARQIGAALGLVASEGPRWTGAHGTALIGVGPKAWLAYREPPPLNWHSDLRERLMAIGSVSDQSGAYRRFRLTGPGARTVLQRGAPIDLDPASFGVGASAVTAIARVGVIVLQLETTPVFDVLVDRSYAESMLDWLEQAVAAL
jgi:methylglutamate dehydrogenase subunit D